MSRPVESAPLNASSLARVFKADPMLNFDSFSRSPGSKQQAVQAVEEKGKDTILRVCLAPVGEEMPLRALGYVASLLRLAQYMPEADVQIVTPVHTLKRVNGNHTALAAAHELAKDTGVFFNILDAMPKPPRFMVDKPEVPDVDPKQIQVALDGTKECERLKSQANRRGDTDTYAHYVAGHMAVYETVDSVQPLLSSDNDPIPDGKRILIMASQSERVFDGALRICREKGIGISGPMAQSCLVYSRYVRPPYLRTLPDPTGEITYFDPMLGDYLALKNPILDNEHEVAADSVKRDLVFTRRAVLAGLGFEQNLAPLPLPTS